MVNVTTAALRGDSLLGSISTVRHTEDRGRAVFASRRIPAGSTVHVVSLPYVCVIKENFRREACAWCFKYQHGKICPVTHPTPCTGVYFCSVDCLQCWTKADHDGQLAEALAALRTNKARKVSAVEGFPLDQAKLVASVIVERRREARRPVDMPSWTDVLDLGPGDLDDEIDLPTEVRQINPFLKQILSTDLRSLVESTSYPFLSRHLSNSFGIWELPLSPDSENLGSAMYPSASYFNHSCEPNVAKLRKGRAFLFFTSREVQAGEELCISYGSTERHVVERGQYLRDWWGFTCTCPRCKRELDRLDS